jgi:hypothetical protein
MLPLPSDRRWVIMRDLVCTGTSSPLGNVGIPPFCRFLSPSCLGRGSHLSAGTCADRRVNVSRNRGKGSDAGRTVYDRQNGMSANTAKNVSSATIVGVLHMTRCEGDVIRVWLWD